MGLLAARASDGPLSLESLLPFAGPLALAGHSALLLESLVSNQFGGVPARVEEFVPRRAEVSEVQRCRLGDRNSTLGGDWVLGASVPDLSGKFRLWIGPLGLDEYHSFLPGQPNRRRLAAVVEATVRSRLEYEVVLTLRDGVVAPWRLGEPAALGYDAWLTDGEAFENTIVSAA